jgi:hypothetical protein
MEATVAAERWKLVAKISSRSEYAVPNAETRHESTSGNCQALPEECSETENRKTFGSKIRGLQAQLYQRDSGWEVDGEGRGSAS